MFVAYDKQRERFYTQRINMTLFIILINILYISDMALKKRLRVSYGLTCSKLL